MLSPRRISFGFNHATPLRKTGWSKISCRTLRWLSADDLGHGSFGIFLYPLEGVNGLPVSKPRVQLPRSQQKVWIMGFSEFRLLDGVGFVDEDASFSQRLPHGGYQGSMKIVENEDSAVELLGQWVSPLALQVNLPKIDAYSSFGRKPFGPAKGFSGFVAAHHRQTFLGQKNSVVAITTGQIQDGPG
jgi:hypothetical protein